MPVRSSGYILLLPLALAFSFISLPLDSPSFLASLATLVVSVVIMPVVAMAPADFMPAIVSVVAGAGAGAGAVAAVLSAAVAFALSLLLQAAKLSATTAIRNIERFMSNPPWLLRRTAPSGRRPVSRARPRARAGTRAT